MALTAREWLLLPKEEQKKRGSELSSEECFKLRTLYSELHFSEEEKINISQQKREEFLHPRERTKEEKEAFNQQADKIFKKLSEEAKKKKYHQSK